MTKDFDDLPQHALVFSLAVLARDDFEAGVLDQALGHEHFQTRILSCVESVLMKAKAEALQTNAPTSVDVTWLESGHPLASEKWTDEELLEELEERAFESRVKDVYGWGADYKRGFTNGLAYGLAWAGRLAMQSVDRAINRGWERARAELKDRGMEPEALAPEDAGVEALDLLGRFVAMVNTNYDPETMRSTGVVAHARRLLDRAGAWPPSGAQS